MELVHMICGFCSPDDLISLSLTSKWMRNMVSFRDIYLKALQRERLKMLQSRYNVAVIPSRPTPGAKWTPVRVVKYDISKGLVQVQRGQSKKLETVSIATLKPVRHRRFRSGKLKFNSVNYHVRMMVKDCPSCGGTHPYDNTSKNGQLLACLSRLYSNPSIVLKANLTITEFYIQGK